MALQNFIRFCAVFAIAAGILEIVGALRLSDPTSITTEFIYIATDLCLLLGFLAWHLHQHEEVGMLGLSGFVLAFLATGFIAGPSATIADMPAYTIGSPIVVLGTLIMAISSHRSRMLMAITPLIFFAFAIVAVLSQFITALYYPIAMPNLVMGVGFILVGFQIIRGREP